MKCSLNLLADLGSPFRDNYPAHKADSAPFEEITEDSMRQGPTHTLRWLSGLSAIVLTVVAVSATVQASDWTSWRGPNQNGVSIESGLPDSTDQVLWRVPMGSRCSTPSIVDGRVFCIGLAGNGVTEQERVFALDLNSGETVWESRFNVFHTDIPNSRVGWSSVAVDPETGNVYSHGVQGLFHCYNRDGKLLWSKSLTETVGRISGYGGRTHTPVIDEDRVVISFLNSSFGPQGKGAHRYLAMDKHTGEMLWWSEPGGKPQDTTYSVPVVTTVGGHRLLIGGNADGGVYALDSRTGVKVWGFQLSKRGINSSVIVENGRVYATHSEENHDSVNMGRVVCIDANGSGDITKTNEIWRHDGVAAGYASPLLHDGRLYVMANSGVLRCFDAEDGKEHWQHTVGRVGKGSPVWGDGKIFVPVVDSKFAILRDLGDKAEQVSVLTFHSEVGEVEIFGSPSIADGRVVLFTADEAICFGDKNHAEKASSLNASVVSKKDTSSETSELDLIQVRPCEVLLSPGDTVPFKAVGFDALGKSLGKQKASWSFGGSVGEVNADGEFNAKGDAGGIGMVTAKLGDRTATARVRVVPPLAIEEDFDSYPEDGMISWWIGVSKAKYAMATMDGNRVLKKLADNRGPIFNRSRVYITEPLPAGYTVQADLMGEQERRRRGDVGLINARYRMELFGKVQRLRVMSWVPGPRFEKAIPFKWEPGVWYTARFQVVPEGDTARVLAKVWPRDEAEPEEWTIEAVDPRPNLEGSAGIYAFSMAPLYYDNVKISK
jgi:outer membrane protein assembly factor BamB